MIWPVMILVIIFAAALFAMIYFHTDPVFIKQTPAAKNGTIDLSEWDFSKDGAVTLKGEWECYDGQLLLPEDFSGAGQQAPQLTGYEKLTADRLESPKSALLNPIGIRTYRLVVKTDPSLQSFGLKTGNIKMSSRLFVNGELLGSSGSPAEKEEVYLPRDVPYTAYFMNSKDQMEILLQTANFDDPSRGFLYTLVLGNQKDIGFQNNLIFSVELCGTFLFFLFGLYYLFLYGAGVGDKSLLPAALMFFFIAAIFPFSGMKYIYSFIPDMPYELSVKVKILSLLGVALSILAYTAATNKKVLSDTFRKTIFIVYAIFLFIIVAAPLRFQAYLNAAALFSIEAVYVYVLVKLWMFYRKSPLRSGIRRQTILQSVCLGSLLICLLNNSLYNTGMVSNKGVGSTALGIFAICSMLTLAYQFAHNYKTMVSMDQVKNEFITKTSYNLKTSLGSLVSLSEALLSEEGKEDLPEGDYQKTVVIKNTALRLLDLVNSTLDVSLDQLKLDISPVNMKACAEQVIADFAEPAQNSKIQFLVNVPAGLMVEADEGKVSQVLRNLVQNSVQSMEAGTVTVYGRQAGDRVQVLVEDGGCGIPEENRDDIFKPYMALKSQGIGLGLYISRQLLELMGGEIRLEWSQVNEGSRFVFSLPACIGKSKPADTESKERERGLKPALTAFLGLTDSKKPEHAVLIVDAEKSALQTASYILTKEGYEVLTSFSGSEALQIIEENKIDLVLLDVMLPGHSGIEACRKIREKYSFIEQPVLVSTAGDIDYDLELIMKEGANDFILKPFEAKEMISKAKTLIALKSLDVNVDELVQTVKVRTLTVLKSLTEDAVKSELAFLQAQIKPHFIYNAINTIASFCYTDGEKAAELLANFSKYLRLTFDIDNRLMMIPLKQEIEMIMAYAEIEKARFGDLIRIEYDVAPDLMHMEIPPLCIQPLVENAIKHGLCKKEGGGTISVSAKEDDGIFMIRIRDTGIGMPAEKVRLLKGMEYKSEGVGFLNVSRRIRGWRNAQLDIQSTEGEGTTVTITIA